MMRGFKGLDRLLGEKVKLLIGGGAAMLLSYDFSLSTMDIDGIVFKSPVKLSDIEKEIHAVADSLSLPKDWINGYFETFLYTLPQDYENRLNTVFCGKHLTVLSLGLEDLLILKCCAGRDKDIAHARAIIKRPINLDFVDDHLQKLIEASVPQARKAADFFDEIRSDSGK